MVQTRVGYAGSSKASPTYLDIRGHAEVLRVVFDPQRIGFGELVQRWAEWHRPQRSRGQYRSLLIPADGAQQLEVERFAERFGEEFQQIVIAPDSAEAHFWDAEAYHQKYRLRRKQGLVMRLEVELGADWDRHQVATKLNAAREPGFQVEPWLAALSSEARREFERG